MLNFYDELTVIFYMFILGEKYVMTVFGVLSFGDQGINYFPCEYCYQF